MLEVTQKNRYGIEQSLMTCTEQEFSEYFYPHEIITDFSNSSIEHCKEKIYLPTFNCYVEIPVFRKVVYNGRGKIVPVDHLLGLVREYQYQRRQHREMFSTYIPGAKKKWHRGSHIRIVHTTQERKWAHAWDDEEFAPKVRAKRKASNLPEYRDDVWRSRPRNWKSYRNTQWR